MRTLPLLALPVLLAAIACRAGTEAPEGDAARGADASAPMLLEGTAYDSAAKITLPERAPEEYPGLHNVYELSPNIISGSEPHGEEALEKLHEMGVKTIVSVDGKVPDAEAAEALGMRYVHIPIQYKGLTEDELERMSKTFRELEGPFYVHCFHGKHRGPAGAAVGRIVVDGVPRETAIAEMRQYCGTSSKYEGLYRDVATARIPDAAESAAFDYDFESKHQLEGVPGLMVVISRAHDHIEDLEDRGWETDPAHPDVDALNEATKLAQAFDSACELGEVQMAQPDYVGWFESSRDRGADLVAALERLRAGDAAAAAEASAAFGDVQINCSDCHKVYRNH
jgi:protein tyrosine phosphatase (PTP) superfamily phosphohydrolase (DUF442 family)